MTPPDLQARVLALAIGRGLATEAQLKVPGPPPSDPGAAWGPKVQVLVDRGHLSAEVAGLLLWEASQATPEEPASPETVAPDSWMGSDLESAEDPTLATLAWERYTAVELLATGGAGMVFQAFDPKLERRVALKVLKRMSPENANRLLEEARAQAGVEHPNVCKIYEVGENQGHPFIAMQLVTGQSLARSMHDLSLLEKLSVMRDVAEGVHAAHRRGLVHLDLKPGNVLLEFLENGELHPYVTDFGLVAQEGMPGKVIGSVEGTPPFASPEQVRGQREKLDRRSDVYSLGVMLYVLLTAKFPFAASSVGDLVRATLEDPPLPLATAAGALPKDLEWIVRKAMRKDPEDRYSSALVFAEDLECFMEGQPVRARPRTLGYRALTYIRRRRAASLALAAGLLLGLAATAMGLRAAWWARRQGELAQRFEQVVDRADAIVRQDAMLPPHDIRKARAYFWDQVASVRAEMEQSGPALLPGHYALGRAELQHGDPAKALEHLEAAWQSGLRAPVVMAALGEARVNLYFTAREEAEHIQDPVLRGRTQAELDERLRDGGLALLREVNRNLSGAQRVGVEIRLALLEGRWREALQTAKELQRTDPWMYDGWVQEGRAYHASATMGLKRQRLNEALEDLTRAEDALVETTWRFPSAVDSILLQSEVWRLRAEILSQTGGDPFPALEKALERLDRCRLLDPELSSDGLQRAKLLLAEATYLETSGRDPRKVLEELDRLTESEVRRVGVRKGASLLDLRVMGLLGLSRLEPLSDGRAALVSAIDSVQEAIRGNAKEKAPHALLVRVLRHFAEHGPISPQDFSWVMGRAESAFNAALALDPKTSARIDMALLLAHSAERKPTGWDADLARASSCMAEARREETPYLEALAWARISRVEAQHDPERREFLLGRARGFLNSTRPGLEELPFFRREAKILGIP
jgi:tetratricopeptide (TPR) repeat protein